MSCLLNITLFFLLALSPLLTSAMDPTDSGTTENTSSQSETSEENDDASDSEAELDDFNDSFFTLEYQQGALSVNAPNLLIEPQERATQSSVSADSPNENNAPSTDAEQLPLSQSAMAQPDISSAIVPAHSTTVATLSADKEQEISFLQIIQQSNTDFVHVSLNLPNDHRDSPFYRRAIIAGLCLALAQANHLPPSVTDPVFYPCFSHALAHLENESNPCPQIEGNQWVSPMMVALRNNQNTFQGQPRYVEGQAWVDIISKENLILAVYTYQRSSSEEVSSAFDSDEHSPHVAPYSVIRLITTNGNIVNIPDAQFFADIVSIISQQNNLGLRAIESQVTPDENRLVPSLPEEGNTDNNLFENLPLSDIIARHQNNSNPVDPLPDFPALLEEEAVDTEPTTQESSNQAPLENLCSVSEESSEAEADCQTNQPFQASMALSHRHREREMLLVETQANFSRLRVELIPLHSTRIAGLTAFTQDSSGPRISPQENSAESPQREVIPSNRSLVSFARSIFRAFQNHYPEILTTGVVIILFLMPSHPRCISIGVTH